MELVGSGTGSTNKSGYGQYSPRQGITLGAHKASFLKTYVVSIPQGMQLDHFVKIKFVLIPTS